MMRFTKAEQKCKELEYKDKMTKLTRKDEHTITAYIPLREYEEEPVNQC